MQSDNSPKSCNSSPRVKSIIRSVPSIIDPASKFKFVENSQVSNTSMKFGLKKSKPDERDKYFSFFTYEKLPMPFQFCLENYVVFDQGNINSCSANSVSNQIKLSCEDMPCHIIPSRLFIYINTRMEDAEENNQIYISDEGSSLKNVYKSILKYNIVDEKYYEYNEDNVNVFPSKELYNMALKNERVIESYRKVIPLEYNLKYILYKIRRPIVAGISMYENFMRITKTGDNGKFYMSYDMITDDKLLFECWLVNT